MTHRAECTHAMDCVPAQEMKKGFRFRKPFSFCIGGAAGRIRTHDPLVRSQVLYPTELQPHARQRLYRTLVLCKPLREKLSGCVRQNAAMRLPAIARADRASGIVPRLDLEPQLHAGCGVPVRADIEREEPAQQVRIDLGAVDVDGLLAAVLPPVRFDERIDTGEAGCCALYRRTPKPVALESPSMSGACVPVAALPGW